MPTTVRPFRVFELRDLFPSYPDPTKIDPKLLTLVQLCGQMELPFPAEPNHEYSTWWHALHEIGHWAVKPPWYIEYSNWLRDDIVQQRGSLFIPAGTIPDAKETVAFPSYTVYKAGNDLIPDIALPFDPTPGEDETRVWSLLMIQRYGWPHPFDENKVNGIVGITSGDMAFHKAASARVWSKGQLHNPDIARSMVRWGIEPQLGMYRAYDDGFRLPYPDPSRSGHLVANMDAVLARYGSGNLTDYERSAWIDDYLLPRYAKRFG